MADIRKNQIDGEACSNHLFFARTFRKTAQVLQGHNENIKKGEGESFLPRLFFVFSRIQSIRLAAFYAAVPVADNHSRKFRLYSVRLSGELFRL